MKTTRISAALGAALSLALLAGCGGTEDDASAVSSDAIVVAACQDAIATLRAQTDAAQYTSWQNPSQAAKDEAGLLAKLDVAASKLSVGDLREAVKKLEMYLHELQGLIAHGDIVPSPDGSVTPEMLLAGGQAAIACTKTP